MPPTSSRRCPVSISNLMIRPWSSSRHARQISANSLSARTVPRLWLGGTIGPENRVCGDIESFAHCPIEHRRQSRAGSCRCYSTALGLDLGKTSGDLSAAQVENRDRMQGLPIDQQVPFSLGIAARLLLFLGMLQVVIRDLTERVSCFSSGLDLLSLWVFTIGNEAKQPLCFSPRLVGGPRRTMPADGDEALPPKDPIFDDIDRVAALASDAKPLYRFLVASVPNRLAGLQRLNCSNRDAP